MRRRNTFLGMDAPEAFVVGLLSGYIVTFIALMFIVG